MQCGIQIFNMGNFISSLTFTLFLIPSCNPLFLPLLLSVLSFLLYLHLAGVQWLPGGGVCLRDRVHWHQGTHMDLYACTCSLCSWHHGGGSDWLPGAGLVDLPDYPLYMHLALLALLLEVPRDAFLPDGQGPLQGNSNPAGHDSPLQWPWVQAEGWGSPGAGRPEWQSSAGEGVRGAAIAVRKEAVHPGSVRQLEDGGAHMHSVGHLVHRQPGLLRLLFGLSQLRRKPVH